MNVYERRKCEDFSEWTDEFTIGNQTQAQANSTKLIKKRDIEPIVAVLNQDLSLKSIDVKASWKDDCLRIMLVSEQKIESDFASIIKNKIFDLNIESCRKIRICSQQINDNFPDWLEEYYNEKPQYAEVISRTTFASSTKSKLALAKQGDSCAIAYSLNYLFQKRQIIATAVINNNCLEITLQANKTPDPDSLITYITNFVHKLKIMQNADRYFTNSCLAKRRNFSSLE
ncbi:MAG: hypothetical protein ACFCAD_17030 [Pleurocapsa sp.]